jgi:hypothetical protein
MSDTADLDQLLEELLEDLNNYQRNRRWDREQAWCNFALRLLLCVLLLGAVGAFLGPIVLVGALPLWWVLRRLLPAPQRRDPWKRYQVK